MSEPGDTPAALRDSVCGEWQQPENYYSQDSGGMTVQNLRDIHDVAIADDGFDAAYFEYWREAVSRPPITPPLDVLCLVIATESPQAAQEWLDAGRTTPAGLLGVYHPQDGTQVRFDDETAAEPGTTSFAIVSDGMTADTAGTNETGDGLRALGRATITGSLVHVILVGSTEELPDAVAAEQLLSTVFDTIPEPE